MESAPYCQDQYQSHLEEVVALKILQEKLLIRHLETSVQHCWCLGHVDYCPTVWNKKEHALYIKFHKILTKCNYNNFFVKLWCLEIFLKCISHLLLSSFTFVYLILSVDCVAFTLKERLLSYLHAGTISLLFYYCPKQYQIPDTGVDTRKETVIQLVKHLNSSNQCRKTQWLLQDGTALSVHWGNSTTYPQVIITAIPTSHSSNMWHDQGEWVGCREYWF